MGNNAIITVQFQQFGVQLAFTPTIIDADHLSLRVRPEVSQLDFADAVTVAGSLVPALTVDRADTTVELASGQSFALAGLLMHNTSQNLSKVPWLGDVPILGALFRSNKFQNDETELVVIVTPYLVRPATMALATPTRWFRRAARRPAGAVGRHLATEPAGSSARAARRRRLGADRARRVPAELRARVMRKHLYRFALALLPLLAGCVPGVAEYTKSEAPARLRVDGGTSKASFAFAPGSARLAAGQALRLDRLVADGAIRPADRVEIAAAGPPALSMARSAAISSRLLRWGIVADARPLTSVLPNRAVVMVGHYAVTLPACPDWSMRPASDFSNAPSSNFGCATAINLGLMAASPGDLASGRSLAAADGEPAAAAVDRYLKDKSYPLPAEAELAPVGSGGGGGGSGGASGTGGQ